MGIEIERKFLVDRCLFQPSTKGKKIHQLYLKRTENHSLRIRIIEKQAFITIKSAISAIIRNEFEYEIPLGDAQEMFEIFHEMPTIEKIRFQEMMDGKVWVIDEFLGNNKGLLMAEIELKSSKELFSKPNWLLGEVTHDFRYHNSNLATFPYSKWPDYKP